MVLDRLNTASSISDLRADFNNLKLHNDQETKSLDILFIEKGKYVTSNFIFCVKIEIE
jgi:hypothetical protein